MPSLLHLASCFPFLLGRHFPNTAHFSLLDFHLLWSFGPSVLQPLISTLSRKPSVYTSLLSNLQSRFAISLLAIRLLFRRVLSHVLPSLYLSRSVLFPVSSNDFILSSITYLTIFSHASIVSFYLYLSSLPFCCSSPLLLSVSFCCRPPTFFKPVSLAFRLNSVILLCVRPVSTPRHLALFTPALLLVPSSSPSPHLLSPCLTSPQSPSPKSCSVTLATSTRPVQPNPASIPAPSLHQSYFLLAL